MTEQPEVAPWRSKLQAALVLGSAIAGAAAGAVLIYFDFHNSAELRAFESAPACQTPADALTTDTCTYRAAATVAATSQGSTLSVDLTFPALPGHTFVATFPTDREPDPSSLNSGASGPAVLWNGQVTEFAGVNSVQNPRYLPQHMALAGWIILVAGVGLAGAATGLVRRAWRG